MIGALPGTDRLPTCHCDIAPGIPIEFTMQVDAKGGGSTIRIPHGEPQVGAIGELEPLFRGAARAALDRLAALLENADA